MEMDGPPWDPRVEGPQKAVVPGRAASPVPWIHWVRGVVGESVAARGRGLCSDPSRAVGCSEQVSSVHHRVCEHRGGLVWGVLPVHTHSEPQSSPRDAHILLSVCPMWHPIKAKKQYVLEIRSPGSEYQLCLPLADTPLPPLSEEVGTFVPCGSLTVEWDSGFMAGTWPGLSTS